MFTKITPESIKDNVFSLIGQDWMLVAAGTLQKYNMMTASWGGMGILWGKPVVYIVIRPTRYTYTFTETHSHFSINFLPESYRSVLNLCGEKSGKTFDKMKKAGVTAVEDGHTIYFNEARLVFLCKKVYYQDLDPTHFLDPGIHKNYSKKDYHRMYIGEIETIYAQ